MPQLQVSKEAAAFPTTSTAAGTFGHGFGVYMMIPNGPEKGHQAGVGNAYGIPAFQNEHDVNS